MSTNTIPAPKCHNKAECIAIPASKLPMLLEAIEEKLTTLYRRRMHLADRMGWLGSMQSPDALAKCMQEHSNIGTEIEAYNALARELNHD